MTFTLRPATPADQAELHHLIARSARGLRGDDYSAEQIEGALRGTFGVDSQLIADGSYIVAVAPDGRLVGCGGWSKRRTLFGGDAHGARDASELDPAIDPARIRAFFVDPGHARQGVGRALLERCERDAAAHGFTRCELMGTLPGVRLYAAMGYAAEERVRQPLGDGLTMDFVRMTRSLGGVGVQPPLHPQPREST